MDNTQSIKNWISYWKSSKGFFDTMSDSEQAERWNNRWGNRASGLQNSLTPARKRKRMAQIFELLNEAGFQPKGATVLDIGCGPGATAIPFAKAGAKVTSLDISSTALQRLKADAQKQGLLIDTIESSWWTTDIDKLGLRNKFDLVLATNTPAVKDIDCFNRMIGCSKNFCYYSFFIQNGGHMQRHHEMLQRIVKKDSTPPSSGKTSLFINIFMYLYLSGYRPLVSINQNQRKRAIAWEQAAEEAIEHMKTTSGCTASAIKKIREHFQASAVEGNYQDNTKRYSGMMVWNVNT